MNLPVQGDVAEDKVNQTSGRRSVGPGQCRLGEGRRWRQPRTRPTFRRGRPLRYPAARRSRPSGQASAVGVESLAQDPSRERRGGLGEFENLPDGRGQAGRRCRDGLGDAGGSRGAPQMGQQLVHVRGRLALGWRRQPRPRHAPTARLPDACAGDAVGGGLMKLERCLFLGIARARWRFFPPWSRRRSISHPSHPRTVTHTVPCAESAGPT